MWPCFDRYIYNYAHFHIHSGKIRQKTTSEKLDKYSSKNGLDRQINDHYKHVTTLGSCPIRKL